MVFFIFCWLVKNRAFLKPIFLKKVIMTYFLLLVSNYFKHNVLLIEIIKNSIDRSIFII